MQRLSKPREMRKGVEYTTSYRWWKRTASQVDDDIVWSLWKHKAAGNAAGIELANDSEHKRYDNPIGIAKNPKYLAFLLGLKRVEKLRLLEGSWYAKEENSGYFKGEWCERLDRRTTDHCKRVRAWDISGSVPSESLPNPDYTAGVLMARDKFGKYYIEDVVRFRDRAHGVLETIIQTAIRDGVSTDIIIPADPGAAGKAYAQSIVKELAERGFYARIFTTNQSKVTRFAPFASIAEAGHVSIVRGDWNDTFIDELEMFDGSRKNKDD